MNIPAWARTPEARTLIAAIIDEQPIPSPRRRPDSCWADNIYRGKTAAALRKLHDEAYSAEIDRANAEHDAGRPWSEARADALARLRPNADALIDMLMEGLAVEPLSELRRTGTGGWL